MLLSTAKKAAENWVKQYAAKEKNFVGAYYSGSTVGMSDHAVLPESSDIDIVVVLKNEEIPLKLGKFIWNKVLLEVTYLSLKQFSSADELLSTYYLAGSFRVNTIISDPTGHLDTLYKNIAPEFAKEKWVRIRCENVFKKIKTGLESIDTTAPYHDLVTSWLFPTGITTHAILVAALRNPTVRLRYVAVREVLDEYNRLDIYEELLALLGCAKLSAQCVDRYVDALEKLFDASVSVAKTPFFFSSDITHSARHVAIDGCRELIQSGFHREAVFWIVATFARCHKILSADASAEFKNTFDKSFQQLISELGIDCRQDFAIRANEVIAFLPTLRNVVDDIIQDHNKQK